MAIQADIFDITIVKFFGGASTGKPITNTHTIEAPVDVTEARLKAEALKIAQSEQKHTSDKVWFSRALIAPHVKGAVIEGEQGSVPCDLAFFGSVDLTFNSYELFSSTVTGGWKGKVLPPEACLAVSFSGGRARTSPHTFRYAIGDFDYDNDGSGVVIKQDYIDFVNNVWRTHIEQQDADVFLVKCREIGENTLAKKVTTVSCLGYQNRQMTNSSRGKALDFDPDTTKPNDAENVISTAVEVLNHVQGDRYTTKGAAFLNSAKFAGALTVLATAAAALKAAKDTNDYGPVSVGG